MSYHRVTQEERIHIYRWSQEGCSQNEIARRLGRDPGTINRELLRNGGLRGYRPKQAGMKARTRAKRSGPRRFTEEVRQHAENLIRQGWTPEVISGRSRQEGRAHVCKETLYKHIYADAKAGGDLWTHLPRSRRKRHRRCPRKDGRGWGCIPNQRRIDTRPPEVETRETVGHWEGDLVNGAVKSGNLVTLVERKTRYALIGKTKTKESLEVMNCISTLFCPFPILARTGMTLDNGKEFALHEDFSRQSGIEVFFAYPYHSWERGSNENLNGLIRRLHPKKSSFSDIGESELKRIECFVNDRPRKCLGWHTPREKMTEFLISLNSISQDCLLEGGFAPLQTTP